MRVILAMSSGVGWLLAILIVLGYQAGKAWWLANTPAGQAHQDRKRAAAQAPSQVECPACHEHDAVRVKVGARVTSGLAGGLLYGRRARAQFQCRNCNYFF